jgi:hypothetical protein
MFDCWLTINDKTVSSSKEATLFISRDCKLWISPISSRSFQFISEKEGCAKMNLKGRKRKRKEKGSAEMN